MIRIIKPGKILQYEFNCLDCGCEYIADLENVEPFDDGMPRGPKVCNCPNCKRLNIGARIEHERTENG